jgi:hypothetical protein
MLKARKWLLIFILTGVIIGTLYLLIKRDVENHFTDELGNVIHIT